MQKCIKCNQKQYFLYSFVCFYVFVYLYINLFFQFTIFFCIMNLFFCLFLYSDSSQVA